MRKILGNLWDSAKPFILAVPLVLLFSTAISQAQIRPMEECQATFTGQPAAITSLSASTWSPGKTYHVLITGVFPGDSATPGCDYTEVSVITAQDPLSGGSAPYVTVSSTKYVSPTQTMATISIAAGAPSATDYLYVTCDGCPIFPAEAVPVQIDGCASPTITDVKPSTWLAGKSYNITIKGTGFTPPDKATAACLFTALTVAAADGSPVFVSNINVVSSTEITASIQPDINDPAQSATVIAGAPPNTGQYTNASITHGQLYLVDPYLFTSSSSGQMSSNDIIASLPANANYAAGVIADGTSTAIAVYASPDKDSVTITAENGATLDNWDPAFLTRAPTSQGSTLSTGSPIKKGSLYYSLALVQAPTNNSAATTQSIEVSVQNGGAANDCGTNNTPDPNPGSCDLGEGYPAVLLIHGLWGNQDSLAGIASFLTTQSGSNANPYGPPAVIAICCSKTVPWYAQPTGSTSTDCGTLTPADAIKNRLDTVSGVYDKNHVVGGRVDVVAHSMGGLAAGFYTTLPRYLTDPRSRNQGALHLVVTIDTPAQGSGLATYLMTVADWKYNPKASALAHAFWKAGKCKPSMTVRQCFNKIGNVIAAPGAPLDSGAIYSLQPYVVNSTPAYIKPPVGAWVALAADFPDAGIPKSLLRFTTQQLVDNLYHGDAPHLSDEVGQGDNDVIVTVGSQTNSNYSNPDVTLYLSGRLQHSSTPDASDYLYELAAIDPRMFDVITDANVLQSNDVDQLVLNALQSGVPNQ